MAHLQCDDAYIPHTPQAKKDRRANVARGLAMTASHDAQLAWDLNEAPARHEQLGNPRWF